MLAGARADPTGDVARATRPRPRSIPTPWPRRHAQTFGNDQVTVRHPSGRDRGPGLACFCCDPRGQCELPPAAAVKELPRACFPTVRITPARPRSSPGIPVVRGPPGRRPRGGRRRADRAVPARSLAVSCHERASAAGRDDGAGADRRADPAPRELVQPAGLRPHPARGRPPEVHRRHHPHELGGSDHPQQRPAGDRLPGAAAPAAHALQGAHRQRVRHLPGQEADHRGDGQLHRLAARASGSWSRPRPSRSPTSTATSSGCRMCSCRTR